MHHHAHTHSPRDFFSTAFGGALAGASIVEEAFLRATWARAQAPRASTNLFKIEKIADGVYAALARPQVLTNCNAAIFVNSQAVFVVDAHSKPWWILTSSSQRSSVIRAGDPVLGREVIEPSPPESPEVVVAAFQRSEIRQTSEVPLASERSPVTSLLQQRWQRRVFGPQAVPALVLHRLFESHPRPVLIPPGDEGRPCGRADRGV